MNKERNAFSEQRRNAKKRGIPFHFHFEEWCIWWEQQLGPDWFQMRGIGKFVMARIGDRGPYAHWNVRCITHAVNSREAAKITDAQILAIYRSSKNAAALAKEYNIDHSHAKRIKNGKVARSIIFQRRGVTRAVG